MKNKKYLPLFRGLVVVAMGIAGVVALTGCPAQGAAASGRMFASGGPGGEVLMTLRDILTEEQRAVLREAFGANAENRAARQEHTAAQRELLQQMDLTQQQRDALRTIVETWSQDLVARATAVARAKAALRDAVLAEVPDDDAIVAAAHHVGEATAEIALLVTTVAQEARAVLTAEQQAILTEVRSNQEAWRTARLDSLPGKVDELFALQEALGITDEQRDEIREALAGAREERNTLRERVHRRFGG